MIAYDRYLCNFYLILFKDDLTAFVITLCHSMLTVNDDLGRMRMEAIVLFKGRATSPTCTLRN